MEQDKPKKATPSKEAKPIPPRTQLAWVNEKAVGLGIYADEKPTGTSHYAEVSRSYVAKKDAEGNVTEWGYSKRLYKKHLMYLKNAVDKALEKVTELDENVEDEQYPEADQKAA